MVPRDFQELRKKLERISKDFRQFSEWFQESYTMKENKVSINSLLKRFVLYKLISFIKTFIVKWNIQINWSLFELLIVQSVPSETQYLRYFSLHIFVRFAIFLEPFPKIKSPIWTFGPFTFQNYCIASDMKISQIFSRICQQ